MKKISHPCSSFMHEHLRQSSGRTPEAPQLPYDLLPWKEAVRRQAKYLIYERVLPKKDIPPTIRPAFPTPGTEGPYLRMREQKEAAWIESLQQTERALLETYGQEAESIRMPSPEAFKEYVEPLLDTPRTNSYRRNPSFRVPGDTVRRLLESTAEQNPLILKKILDGIEDAKEALEPIEEAAREKINEQNERAETINIAKTYFPALEALDSGSQPAKFTKDDERKLIELESDEDLAQEIRKIKQTLGGWKHLSEDELTEQQKTLKERYKLEQELDKTSGRTRERLAGMLNSADYDYTLETPEEPEEITTEYLTQTPDANGQNDRYQTTEANAEPSTPLSPDLLEAAEMAERERVWAESYFIPLHALENGFSLSALTEEERAKAQQLKENRNLLQTIYGLREKARGESINRREAAMQKAQELIREIMDLGRGFGFERLREEGGPALIQAYAQLEKILAEEKKSSSHQLSPEDRRKLETQLSDLKSCYDVLYATPL